MADSLLKVGEPAPWFSSTSIGNNRDRVAIDELAGANIVLLFFAGAGSGLSEEIARLADADLFDGDRALFMGLSRDPDASVAELASQSRPGRYFLHDPNGAVAQQYGLGEAGQADGPVAFILTASLQIADIVPFGPGSAEQIVSAVRQRIAVPPPMLNPPVLVVPGVFDRAFCDRLVELHQLAGGREIGVIESGGQAIGGQFESSFRKRLDWYISDDATQQEARDLLARRLLPMVYRAFQFRTTRIERYLVGCYDAATGGRFAPHRDNTAPPVAHRRFALTINLNDSYDGGYLRFPEFGPQKFRAAPGDAIVFSCSLLHEVTPITRDRRFAFLSFLYDEQSQQLRDAYAKQVAEQQKAQAG